MVKNWHCLGFETFGLKIQVKWPTQFLCILNVYLHEIRLVTTFMINNWALKMKRQTCLLHLWPKRLVSWTLNIPGNFRSWKRCFKYGLLKFFLAYFKHLKDSYSITTYMHYEHVGVRYCKYLHILSLGFH